VNIEPFHWTVQQAAERWRPHWSMQQSDVWLHQ